MEADLPIYGLASPNIKDMHNEFDTKTNLKNCGCSMKKRPPLLLLQGMITDSKTKAPFEAGLVNVYNVTKGTGTLPDADGMYELRASYDDQIRISFVGYKTVTLPASEVPKAIELQQQTQDLDEIVITAKKKSKNYMYAGLGFTALFLMYISAEGDKRKNRNRKKKV